MKAARPVAALAAMLAACAAGSAAGQEGQGGQAMSGAAPPAHDARAASAVQPEQRPGQSATARAPRNNPPPRRRSVQQIIATVPPPLAAQGYGPVLYPPTPAPGIAPAYPPAATAINGCQGSICTDAAGTTYNLGVGNAGVSSQGRLCSRNGQTVQCF